MASKYPADLQQRALDLYVEHGPQHAADLLGLPAGTVRRWAHERGLASKANDRRREQVEATRLTTQQRSFARAEQIEANVDKALRLTLERLDDPTARLSEIVGVWTRGIHDLALLTGGVTERTEQVGDVDNDIQTLLEEMAATDPEAVE